MSAPFPYLRFGSLIRQAAALALVALVVAGCASTQPAPVEDRGPAARASLAKPGAAKRPAGENGPATTYTVKRGDTLYQIALDNGLDYRELASWNNIDNVNRIYVGQVLRLAAPGQLPAAAQVAAAGSTAAPGSAPGGATTSPDGVTVTPLRSVPPVVAASAPSATTAANPEAALPPGASPAAAPGTIPPVAAPGAAAAGTGAVAGAAPAGAATDVGNLKTSPRAIKQPYSDQAVRQMTLEASAVPAPPNAVVASVAPSGVAQVPPAAAGPQAAPSSPAPTPGDDQLNWMWPAKGKVVAQFSDTANLKGIDIAGTAGEPVYASAAGRVVYAGSGLRGYGKLIIIKHNATYLSAYAHNQNILVKEGQQVARGQKIAEMGSTDASQVMLHFEIRRFGKPMDPEKFLPPV
jgi:lipoprotein NlpD